MKQDINIVLERLAEKLRRLQPEKTNPGKAAARIQVLKDTVANGMVDRTGTHWTIQDFLVLERSIDNELARRRF